MANLPKINKKMSTILHSLGLSSIGGALFLQGTVFTDILRFGYFRGIEQNPLILSSELALTGVGVAYFAFMFGRFILSYV